MSKPITKRRYVFQVAGEFRVVFHVDPLLAEPYCVRYLDDLLDQPMANRLLETYRDPIRAALHDKALAAVRYGVSKPTALERASGVLLMQYDPLDMTALPVEILSVTDFDDRDMAEFAGAGIPEFLTEGES